MTKTQLRKDIRIDTATLARLSIKEKVSLNVIERICVTLDCQSESIIEFISREKQNLLLYHKLIDSYC